MDEGWPRPGADNEYRRRDEPPIMRRPDRIALWAVGIAVVAMIAAVASAHGATPTKHFTHAGHVHAASIRK
jgi:hypothetical protein